MVVGGVLQQPRLYVLTPINWTGVGVTFVAGCSYAYLAFHHKKDATASQLLGKAPAPEYGSF